MRYGHVFAVQHAVTSVAPKTNAGDPYLATALFATRGLSMMCQQPHSISTRQRLHWCRHVWNLFSGAVRSHDTLHPPTAAAAPAPPPLPPNGNNKEANLLLCVALSPLACSSPTPQIHVADDDPFSLTRGGGLEDVSLVKKYRMSEEDYDKRKGTLR